MMADNSNKRIYRTPTDGQSTIEVSPQPNGRGVDLVFRRSTHGEVLVRLSWAQAEAVGRDIASVISASQAPKDTA